MNLVSRISPDAGTTAGLLTAAGVYLIYNNALPTTAELRMTSPNNTDAESSRKSAAWLSAILVGTVFVVTKNLDTFLIGGSALVGIDWMHKHANAVHPATGQIDTSDSGTTIAPGMADAYSLPQYDADSDS